ncbi:hypothetical protein HQ865_19955 [Mucilaginibacter mali]|uniref:Uncharacterized protein n=1 Tax=Mucilaginibacter mali TaxID=2740462 RepID=A0A7D4ULL5_9SPHI|nr:hypothetical protein [Mucilaginibacter mali]QKJ31942.1 hypothetical protein HQ865_19955 [Mucilaginibacter mali]
MTTLTIEIPDKDRDLFEQLTQRLNGKIVNVMESEAEPNNITKKAITEARAGKTQKIEDLDAFFQSL